MRQPGSITWPIFGAWNVTVTSAETATSATSPVEASTPLGTSTATTGTPASPIARIASATAAARLTAATGAEQRVDHDVGAAQPVADRADPGDGHARRDCRVARVERVALVRPRGDDETRGIDAERPQPTGGNQAVAAVGTAAADADDAPRRRIPGADDVRDGIAGGRHQLRARHAGGDGCGVGGAHRCGVVQVGPDQSCVPSHVLSFCRSSGTFDSSKV